MGDDSHPHIISHPMPGHNPLTMDLIGCAPLALDLIHYSIRFFIFFFFILYIYILSQDETYLAVAMRQVPCGTRPVVIQ